MSDTIIRVENLGKKYIIGHQKQERYTALRDVMANAAKSLGRKVMSPFGNQTLDPAFEEFWALKDVSFEVKQGDRVGIIGRNGAGKSTLLKVLSRITEPTSGRVSIKGRVASLLEVGTGFHPELTGRENIFLNGAILGMSKIEIKKKFDEIVTFAEVEKFLDTPVKRYSSGIYVRLAFAVAAHLEPEILVVDEVLAVGDAQFQKKCLGKMKDVGQEGRTVLFVSHNMGVLKSLCTSSVLLSKGEVIAQGTTSDVVDTYLMSANNEQSNSGEISWQDKESAPGCAEMHLVSVRLLGDRETVQLNFDPEKPIKIEVIYKILQKLTGMRLVLQVINSEGIIAFASTDHTSRDGGFKPGLYSTCCTIPSYLLNTGLYYLRLHAGIPGVKVLIQQQDFLSFYIEKTTQHGSSFNERWPGVVAPKLFWDTQLISLK